MLKKDTDKLLDEARKVTDQLLNLMGIDVSVEVSYDNENEAVLIDIPAKDEAGLLIGSRGNTLNSLQNIVSLILRQRRGDWARVLVNVADWRTKEQQRLEEMADQTAERALATGEPQTLYNLTPAQRRIVHMTLAENEKISTESRGEGDERYLVVLPK